jgi:predicted membrane-bound mannosyltransferase
VVAGLGLGFMSATKETFVIPMFAMVVALGLNLGFERWRHGRMPEWRTCCTWRAVVAGGLAAGVIWVVFFTSFFTHWSGPLDSIRSYLPWLERAGGKSPHLHPWCFYLERLAWYHPPRGTIWSEGIILVLALVGCVAAFAGKGLGTAHAGLARWLAFYTVVLTTVYSVISYKTPWCMLGFLHGFILLAGIGAAALWSWSRTVGWKVVLALVFAAGAVQLTVQAYRASYERPADWRNPYAYAQTVPNILELMERVEGIAKAHPEQHRMIVTVISPESYWPLPWYLRRFERVGYWDTVPENPYSPVILVNARLEAALDERSSKKWLSVGMYEIRPKVFLEMYVEFEVWRKYLETRPPPPPDD